MEKVKVSMIGKNYAAVKSFSYSHSSFAIKNDLGSFGEPEMMLD